MFVISFYQYNFDCIMENKNIYLLPNLEVKESSIHGKGIFTKIDIPEDEIILVIEGEVIDGNECERREEEEDNVYIFWNGDNYIDTTKNELIRHLNHICDPNCYVDDRDEHTLFLIAAKNIKAGEELTIDYDYEEIYQHCKCGDCKTTNENE